MAAVTGRPSDLVLAGGLLVDGTGEPVRPADVAITGDRISAVGPPGTLRGTTTTDIAGLIVMPGFFDIHSHADFTLLADGRADSAVAQGVTSIVTGNCGYGVAPATPESHDLACLQVPGWQAGITAARLRPQRSFGDYLDLLRSRGVGVNVFPLVAHGPLRLSAVGAETRPASTSEIADLVVLAKDAMQAGAIGFSTGLEYAPGIAATEDELAAICAVVGEFDGLYATHCRNRSERIEAAVAEAVRAADAGSCRLQLSHFLPRPALPDPAAYRRALDRCRDAAVPVRFDAFPFEHGPTPLAVLLPSWVRQGSRAEVAGRLADARTRSAIAEQFDDRFMETVHGGVAAEMRLVSDGVGGVFAGQSLGALKGGRSIPETVLELLAGAGENFAAVTVLERWATDSDLLDALAADDYFIMSDGITQSLAEGAAGDGFSLSDWSYTPKMLAGFVRDLRLVPLEAAVHRMTMAPARQAGITDRGAVLAGSAADLVVVDLAGLACADDTAEARQPPAGIGAVLVNGRFAVTGGRLTGELAGQVGVVR